MVHTFGWPIAVVLDRDEYRPRPTGEGIRARIATTRTWTAEESSYDYWELRVNGDFYLCHSLFEDQKGRPDQLFFNTRIIRITEGVLYCARLFERLGVAPDHEVNMRIVHDGISGRVLTSSSPGRSLSMPYQTSADTATSLTTFPLGSVGERLVEIVKELTAPLFELFDFFQLGDEVYEEIVNRFVEGKVT